MESRGKKHDSQRCSRSVKKMGKALGLQTCAQGKTQVTEFFHCEDPMSARKDFTLCLLAVSPCVPDGPPDSSTGLSWQSLSLREALER